MSRIVTPQGFIPGGDGKPDRPPTLQERVDTALEHWRFKRKDEGFATALNCILYLSTGLAGLAKLTGELKAVNEALSKRIAVLEEKQTKQP